MNTRTILLKLTSALILASCGGGGVFGEEEPSDQHEARCNFESETVLCRNTAQGIRNYIDEYGPLSEEMDQILMVGFEDHSALEKLRVVKKVGVLQVHSSSGVKDLSFLSGLEEAGSIEIASNKSLRSLEGLENLKVVTYRMTISQNSNLESLEGLENLTRVGTANDGEGLNLIANVSLKNLEGLESFKEAHNLYVQSNNAMRTFGNLPSLEVLGGMDVGFNNELRNLGTAPMLRDIIKGLAVEKNKNFPDCEAEKFLAQAEEFDGGTLIEGNLPNSSCEQLE